MPSKLYDRFAYIRSAGKEKLRDGLTTELQDYSKNELAENLIISQLPNKKIQKFDLSDRISKAQTIRENADTAQTVIEANLNKFRFQEFQEEFKEDLYYQSAKAGRTGQASRIGSKPDFVTNTSRTFGKKAYVNEFPAYEIIFPKKSASDILKEQQKSHNMYIKSHGSYFPSERIRRYNTESFDPEGKTFGRPTGVEATGKRVKNALTDCLYGQADEMNKIQKDFLQRKVPELGKPRKTQQIEHFKALRYGRRNKPDEYNLSCLIRNSSPNADLKELLEALSYVSNLRVRLKNKFDFDFSVLQSTLHQLDVGKCFHLDCKVLFQGLHSFHLHVDQVKLKLVAKHSKMLNEKDQVNFVEFIKLLKCGEPLPNISDSIKYLPANKELSTTYQDFAKDYQFAGRCQKVKETGSILKENSCKTDLRTLIEDIGVKECIAPGIAANFGLSRSDYLLPRSREEIRRVFRNFLQDIDDDRFEKLFDEALQLSSSAGQKASAEAFKYCLVRYRKI